MSAEPHYVQADYREPEKRRKRSLLTPSKRKAFDRGRRAFLRGDSRADVPYRDVVTAQEWERGFDWEQRLSGGRSAGLL